MVIRNALSEFATQCNAFENCTLHRIYWEGLPTPSWFPVKFVSQPKPHSASPAAMTVLLCLGIGTIGTGNG